MASSRDAIVISWPELHRDARTLCKQLLSIGRWHRIVAIARGGLVPAALVARELDIRLIDTLCVTSYGASPTIASERQQGPLQVLKSVAGDGEGSLLIDDLVDTGKTAQAARALLPKAHFATLYAKPTGQPFVDTFVTAFAQSQWIFFPWDVDYHFSEPLTARVK